MTRMVAAPTYHDAVEKLNSTQSGFRTLAEKRRLKELTGKLNDESPKKTGVEQMREWIRRIGYEIDDLNRLNVVHVAGTKGKGTTCAFVNSILHYHQKSTGLPSKVGLYTSPHLVAVRERIRINSYPISEQQFAKYFFEVWHALETSAVKEGIDPTERPPYFRFLTLMAIHVFMREGVDAAILEVGVGGERDSTNVITQPAVTGITTLGIDHVSQLGDTIDKIAWHKAGIFKTGFPAFTMVQVPEAMAVLEQRAEEKSVVLERIDIHPGLLDINLQPSEDFQRKNAALAIKLSQCLLKKLGTPVDLSLRSLPKEIVQGLENTVWRGRCEILATKNQNWLLDGAHTEESLKVASSWFANLPQSQKPPRVLVFNQQSSRDTESLLRTVYNEIYQKTDVKFDYAVFCTNFTYKDNMFKVDLMNRNVNSNELQELTLQKYLADIWRKLDPETKIAVVPSIQETIEYVKKLSGDTEMVTVFVTGSFHLVGGAISVLEGEEVVVQKATVV